MGMIQDGQAGSLDWPVGEMTGQMLKPRKFDLLPKIIRVNESTQKGPLKGSRSKLTTGLSWRETIASLA